MTVRTTHKPWRTRRRAQRAAEVRRALAQRPFAPRLRARGPASMRAGLWCAATRSPSPASSAAAGADESRRTDDDGSSGPLLASAVTARGGATSNKGEFDGDHHRRFVQGLESPVRRRDEAAGAGSTGPGRAVRSPGCRARHLRRARRQRERSRTRRRRPGCRHGVRRPDRRVDRRRGRTRRDASRRIDGFAHGRRDRPRHR